MPLKCEMEIENAIFSEVDGVKVGDKAKIQCTCGDDHEPQSVQCSDDGKWKTEKGDNVQCQTYCKGIYYMALVLCTVLEKTFKYSSVDSALKVNAY